MSNELTVGKSEILFLYESTFSVPNGDPFTGEQRYDEETRKVLVSDVRIKRFIRDYFANAGESVYVVNPKSTESEDRDESGAAKRFRQLQEEFKELKNPIEVLLKCIDARLFGAVVTLKDDKKGKKKADGAADSEDKKERAFNVTGPVQFALLNPSLNSAELRMHQNTSVFPSGKGKEQGAIGTTTVVPYALNQIHGWINPFSAIHTKLTEKDIGQMFKALWESINNANTRTKSNQNSLLLLQIVYADPTKKLYGLDRLIKLNSDKSGKRDDQIRNSDDYELDFSKLKEAVSSEKVSVVNFYTEVNAIKEELEKDNQFKVMSWQ